MKCSFRLPSLFTTSSPWKGLSQPRLSLDLLPVAAALFILSAGVAHAAPQSIHEGGATVPIGHLTAPLYSKATAPRAQLTAPSPNQFLPVRFPVVTKEMRPGVLAGPLRIQAKYLSAPMFIVGDDEASHRWLSNNREALSRHGASGMVVNVQSLQSFKALRSSAPALMMAPSPGSEIAKYLGLGMYPVYIGADGMVTQQVPQ